MKFRTFIPKVFILSVFCALVFTACEQEEITLQEESQVDQLSALQPGDRIKLNKTEIDGLLMAEYGYVETD